MTDMKIEPGEFYRTRIGIRAFIYAVDQGGSKPIHGAIYDGIKWDIRCWDRLGRFAPEFSIHHNIDLVSPWIDPPAVDWDKFPKHIVAVAMDRSGTWNAYLDKPSLGFDCWCVSNRRYAWMHSRLCEDDIPNFTGDWRDSLAIRPGHEDE